LTDTEKAIIELERTWWSQSADKSELIESQLGLTPGVYYQLLNELIDRPEALAEDALVVRRLRRLRDRRRRTHMGAVTPTDALADDVLVDARGDG